MSWCEGDGIVFVSWSGSHVGCCEADGPSVTLAVV